jgi:hopanoid biosynthesis associated protein HpnK
MKGVLIFRKFRAGVAPAVSSARPPARQTDADEPRFGNKTGRRLRLIVNADDFGISEEVNESVVRAFKDGVLTSCSLMVTGAAFDQAVKLAKDNPKLSVGIHVVTVMGQSVLSKSEIPTLVDEEKNFSNNPTAAGLKYYFSKRARLELGKELAAQFEKFKSTGLSLSHIDGHLHMHVHPVIFNAALMLGAAYGAKRMRVPQEERRLALGFDGNRAFKKTVHALLFGGLAWYMKNKLKRRGFMFAERVYGNLQSDSVNEQYLLYTLENLRAEINEFYCHPAVYGPDRALNDEECQHLREFQALMSESVVHRLSHLGIELTNYFDLEAKR